MTSVPSVSVAQTAGRTAIKVQIQDQISDQALDSSAGARHSKMPPKSVASRSKSAKTISWKTGFEQTQTMMTEAKALQSTPWLLFTRAVRHLGHIVDDGLPGALTAQDARVPAEEQTGMFTLCSCVQSTPSPLVWFPLALALGLDPIIRLCKTTFHPSSLSFLTQLNLIQIYIKIP